MPQVPKYGAPKADPTPLPAARLRTPAENYATAGGELGEAMSQTGAQVQQLALQWYEKAKRDRLALFQGDSRNGIYAIEHYALTSPDRGPDGTGHKGILNQKGLEPSQNIDAVLEAIDLQAEELAKQAKSAEERAWFTAEWNQSRAQIRARMLGHASQELQRHNKGSFDATLENLANRAGIHAPNGAAGRLVIGETVTKAIETIDTRGPGLGYSPDELTLLKDQTVSKIYGAAVNAMLQAKQPGEAGRFWASVRDQVQDATLRAQLDDRVKQRTTEAIAFAVVDKVLTALGPKQRTDTIQQTPMEDAVRAELKDDPDAMQAGIAELRSRILGIEQQRQNELGAAKLVLWGAFNKASKADRLSGKVWAALSGTPEARDYPELARDVSEALRREQEHEETLKNQAAARANAAESRAAAADAREFQNDLRVERRLELEGWATYNQYRQDAWLDAHNVGDINELAKELGQAHVQRLLQDKEDRTRRLQTFGDARTVENDLVTSIGRSALDYFADPKNDVQRANAAKLRSALIEAVTTAQARGNKVLSHTEQENEMQDVIKHVVRLRENYFFDDDDLIAVLERDAITADPEKRKQVYVPFDNIPQAARDQYYNLLRGEPTFAQMSDKERARRIEHAFGLWLLYDKSPTPLTQSQVLAALREGN
jgi:hypothetical protein